MFRTNAPSCSVLLRSCRTKHRQRQATASASSSRRVCGVWVHGSLTEFHSLGCLQCPLVRQRAFFFVAVLLLTCSKETVRVRAPKSNDIILITIDTLRADSLGYPRNPHV